MSKSKIDSATGVTVKPLSSLASRSATLSEFGSPSLCPPQLDPHVQLTMMSKQYALTRLVDNPSRTRNMTRQTGSLETIIMSRYKLFKSLRRLQFIRKSSFVVFYVVKQPLTMHG